MKIDEKSTYPRPDFIRENYISLNGVWQFSFDDDGTLEEKLKAGEKAKLPLEIRVPFPYQSSLSGIENSEPHERAMYKKCFTVKKNGKKTALLHFGAVDHDALIWLNGSFLGSHSGGYTPFYFDVSGIIKDGENELTVYVTDEFRPDNVRGKQVWDGLPWGCHYTAVTGIWQEVWLEFTGENYINDVKFITDFDSHCVTAELTFNKKTTGFISAVVSKDGSEYMSVRQSAGGRTSKLLFSFEDCGVKDKEVYTWSPSHPNLFDVSFCLETETGKDTVETYFGMRKISTDANKIYFNNSQIYLRMILDQGYWTDGIYRPGNDDEFKKDVERTLKLGFNGARKHQKIEDPKYYYWADRLGLLVWGELPSFYGFTDYACFDAEKTMSEFIERDKNHPCIISWVPFNESWGLRSLLGDSRQADFVRELYYLCKRKDPSRLVSSNDGWENAFPTDICGIHDYRSFTENLSEYYSDTSFLNSGAARTGHPYIIPGESYGGQPVMLTEFGGKRIKNSDGWGYNLPSESIEEYIADIRNDIENILKTPSFCGYCYTQLTDVYQETNGLLYMDRTPKAPEEALEEIFAQVRSRE